MELRQAVKTILLKKPSKPTTKIELFPASLWRTSYKPGRQNVHPRPPSRPDDYWPVYFRVRLDGRWFRAENIRARYCFFTEPEIVTMILEL